MQRALFLTLEQLGETGFRRLVWRSLLYGLFMAILLLAAAFSVLDHLSLAGIPWLDRVIDALGGAGALLFAWFLYPSCVALVAGFMIEPIARAVEARHYPGLPPAYQTSILEDLTIGLKIAGISVLVALVSLLLGFVLPGANLLIFLLLNGYLFGREYFDQLALRRIDKPMVPLLRQKHQAKIWTFGALICVLTLIPVVNLIAPLLATAMMVHLVEALRAERSR